MALEDWDKRACTGFIWLWIGTGAGPFGNKRSGSIVCGEFLYWLWNLWFLKRNPAPLNQFRDTDSASQRGFSCLI